MSGAAQRIGRRAFLARGAAAAAAAAAWRRRAGAGLARQADPRGAGLCAGRRRRRHCSRGGCGASKLLGQPLVVDYKSGASGTIAAAEVARAAPDGYTLALLDNAPLTIVPAMRNTGYDPLASFTHVSMVTQLPQVLVASPSAA